MKREHPVAITIGAALAAAAIVMGAYLLVRHDGAEAPAANALAAPAPAAEDGGPPRAAAPAPGQPSPSKPVLPESLRGNAAPPALPENLPDQEELREQFAMLRRFLELPPDKLARMRESIERIERMPPERKELMLELIRRVDALPAAKTRSGDVLAETPAEIRTKVSSILDRMSPGERADIMELTSKMSAAERNAFFAGMVAGSEKSAARQPLPWKNTEIVPFGPGSGQ